MSTQSILAVEPSPVLQRAFKKHLAGAGYRVVILPGIEKLEQTLGSGEFALVIINVAKSAYPYLHRVQAVKKNSKLKKIVVVFVSKHCTSSAHVVRSLESGVDDYIVLPCTWPVLVARVKALLRRVSFTLTQPPLVFKEIRIDRNAHAVMVNGKSISLTPKEYGLLCLFLEQKGHVLNRAYLMEQIWEYDYFGTTRTVDKHVENLRNKLGKAGKYIETIERVGYRLN
ncbi:MAG: hypothetical protein GF384_03385 [Elusimicrobia bacterium]|nr:hypothetical protein [Elusimicrobiota bacterium]MBD3411961.1 hypothetical protein [Elusimicrobiota bacterium]